MRKLLRPFVLRTTLAVALLATSVPAAAGEPIVPPSGPTFSVAAMSGLGGPLSLLTAGGPGVGIGLGLAPGWAFGRLHLSLPLSVSRYSGYARFVDPSDPSASGGGTVAGTSFVAAPTVEYTLLSRGEVEVSAMAGAILGWFSLTQKIYPAPPTRYVSAGPQFGGLAGLSFRYHVTSRLALGTAGGLQYYGARITETTMPSAAGTTNGVGAFNFFALVELTLYLGKSTPPAAAASDAKKPADAPAGRKDADDAEDDEGDDDEGDSDGDDDEGGGDDDD